MESTVNITAADGKAEAVVLIGKDFRILKDHTAETFVTDSLPDFVEYAKAFDTKQYEVNYNNCNVSLFPTVGDRRYSQPAARCSITENTIVAFVARALNKPLSIAEFEAFLFVVRPFMNDALKTLYAYVRNFKVTKLTEVRRVVDNKGNYEYVIKREKGGQEDVEIPETVTFRLPPIEGADADADGWDFTLDLFFDWKDTNDGVSAAFRLSAPLWDSMVKDAVKATIRKYLEDLPHTAYWGTVVTIPQDDSWKYLFNSDTADKVTIDARVREDKRPF